MKTPSFPQAVGGCLESLGFVREGRDVWNRTVGDFRDTVHLQVSRDFTEVTLNINMVSLSVEAFLRDDCQSPDAARLCLISVRLGTLIDGHDHWWKRSDPDARSQMVKAITDHAIPFLDGLHSLESMRRYFEARYPVRRDNLATRVHLAVILSRLGEADAACGLLYPPSKALISSHGLVRAVRLKLCGDIEVVYPPDIQNSR